MSNRLKKNRRGPTSADGAEHTEKTWSADEQKLADRRLSVFQAKENLHKRNRPVWRRTDVLLGRWVSSVGLVCQGNVGPRRCRREPTPQYAFVATSSSSSA
ncbi:hypothetical protein DPX16_9336 [Anabarilius grahami]|uniref:Uncharacterized protein n=1 Tax=Anabarilius grahami TaxID=495550 RepID=A0A3N0Y6C3_ANAGA|nr:hypothetical protein DPX16_9336 [Anabarilius grahami]